MSEIAATQPLPNRRGLNDLKRRHPGLHFTIDTSAGQPVYSAEETGSDGKRVSYSAGTVEGLGSQIEGPIVEFEDAAKPSIARVYDFWLGGTINFASDRALARKIEALEPGAPTMARANRDFLQRAVRWVASQGIGQFIDAGSGLPTVPAVHQMAREVIPAARVAYVDNELLVIRHWQNEYTLSDPGLVAVAGNLRYPAAVLAVPEMAGLIDLDRPVCVILALVLQFQEATAARKIAAGFIGALAPGSFVIITVPVGETRLAARISETYTAATIHNHPRSVIWSLFQGTEIQAPGVVDAQVWMPHGPVTPPPQRDATFVAGIGRKPGRVAHAASATDPAGGYAR